jgi:hypothetical protein
VDVKTVERILKIREFLSNLDHSMIPYSTANLEVRES